MQKGKQNRLQTTNFNEKTVEINEATSTTIQTMLPSSFHSFLVTDLRASGPLAGSGPSTENTKATHETSSLPKPLWVHPIQKVPAPTEMMVAKSMIMPGDDLANSNLTPPTVSTNILSNTPVHRTRQYVDLKF